MHTGSTLRFLNVDLKAAARGAGDFGRRQILPTPVLTMARHWVDLGGRIAPTWAQFDFLKMGDVAPYLVIARCHSEDIFTFTYMGSAIGAMLSEDLTGRTVNASAPVWGEIDWYRRWKPVAQTADIQVSTGTTNPPYTAGIDFIAADFPFLRDENGEVSHVVGVTATHVN